MIIDNLSSLQIIFDSSKISHNKSALLVSFDNLIDDDIIVNSKVLITSKEENILKNYDIVISKKENSIILSYKDKDRVIYRLDSLLIEFKDEITVSYIDRKSGSFRNDFISSTLNYSDRF